jgi:hypothetical protein
MESSLMRMTQAPDAPLHHVADRMGVFEALQWGTKAQARAAGDNLIGSLERHFINTRAVERMGQTLGLGTVDTEAGEFLRGLVVAAPDQARTFDYLRKAMPGVRGRVASIASGLTEAEFQTRAQSLRGRANRAIERARRDIVGPQSKFPQVRSEAEGLVNQYVGQLPEDYPYKYLRAFATRGWQLAQEHVAFPMIPGIPGVWSGWQVPFLQLGSQFTVRRSWMPELFPALSRQPAIGGTDPISSPVMLLGNKAWEVTDDAVNALGGRFGITSARGGHYANLLSKMLGIAPRETEPGNAISKLLDINLQGAESPSIWGRTRTWLTKFTDPLWGRNLVNALLAGETGTIEVQNARVTAAMISLRSQGGLEDVARLMPRMGGPAIETVEEILGTARQLTSTGTTLSPLMQAYEPRLGNPQQVAQLLRPYTRDPQAFAFLIGSPELQLETVSELQRLRRAVAEEYVLRQLNASGTVSDLSGLIQAVGKGAGLLGPDVTQEGQAFVTATLLGRLSRRAPPEYIERLIRAKGSEAARDLIRKGTFRPLFNITKPFDRPAFSPLSNYQQIGAGRPSNPYGATNYLIMRPGPMTDISESIMSGKMPTGDQVKQAMVDTMSGLTAGRLSPERINAFTLNTYFFVERLNAALNAVGLGMSGASMQSPLHALSNMMLKRMLPVWGGLFYLDYMRDADEGLANLGQGFRNIRANAVMDAAMIRDITGVTEANKTLVDMIPGMDLYFTPRSREEYADYLRAGYDPVRRGRRWLLSRTPWVGENIAYYEPNWWRRSSADWMGTEAGVPDDLYYQYGWLPTPSHPLSPLRRALNPYWLENYHQNTRPAEVTGPLLTPEVPGAGLVNMTLGRVLKPQVLMHPEYVPESLGGQVSQSHLAELNLAIREQRDIRSAATELGARNVMDAGDLGGRSAVLRVTPRGLTRLMGAPQGAVVMTTGGDEVTVGGAIGDQVTSQMTAINRGLAGVSAIRGGTSGLVPLRLPERYRTPMGYSPEDLNQIEGTPGLVTSAQNVWYTATEMAGMWGWLSTVPFGGSQFDFLTSPYRLQTMQAASTERRFWDKDIGGGPLIFQEQFEVFRRFLPHRIRRNNEITYTPNQMPLWMPGTGQYFLDFRTGDPYLKVKKGEMRLPGSGFEEVWPETTMEMSLSDLQMIQRGQAFPEDFYDPISKMRILADVAPYSEQYRVLRDQLVHDPSLTPEQRRELQRIKARVTAVKSKLNVYPYRFRDTGATRTMGLTVSRVVTGRPGVLVYTEELGARHPLTFAGVKPVEYLAEEQGTDLVTALEETGLVPGAKIYAEVHEDYFQRERRAYHTTYSDYRASIIRMNRLPHVPFFRKNINEELRERGLTVDRESDYTPMGVKTRFNWGERQIGGFLEKLAHLNIPGFHRKFLPVDSPLEKFEREYLYGSRAGRWESPVRSYVIPTMDWTASRGMVTGAALGAFFGWNLVKGSWRPWGTAVGAATGAMMSFWRRGRYGDDWVPERRRSQFELWEYGDILKYIKALGLYNVYRNAAIQYEGVDPRKLQIEAQVGGEANARRLMDLLDRKRLLTYQDYEGNREEIQGINLEIASIHGTAGMYSIGPYTARAMLYMKQIRGTAYGLDPTTTNWTARFLAMPKPWREFLPEMQGASLGDRERFYELTPDYLKRVLHAPLGLPSEPPDRPDLTEYFRDHWLPDPAWAGWHPDVDLQKVIMREIDLQGLDPIEVGPFYPQQMEDARRSRVGIPGVESVNFGGSRRRIQNALTRILHGEGLEDVEVFITTEANPGIGDDLIDVTMNIQRDHTDDFIDYVSKEGYTLL